VEIRDLIKSIGKKKTVMLSTHIMQEVEAICDRVVIINKGEIVADDKASVLQQASTVQTVYVEFEDKITKSQLQKIPHVRKVEQVKEGWLLESVDAVDLRRIISKY